MLFKPCNLPTLFESPCQSSSPQVRHANFILLLGRNGAMVAALVRAVSLVSVSTNMSLTDAASNISKEESGCLRQNHPGPTCNRHHGFRPQPTYSFSLHGARKDAAGKADSRSYRTHQPTTPGYDFAKHTRRTTTQRTNARKDQSKDHRG